MSGKKPTTKKPATKRIKPIVEEELKQKEPYSDMEVIGNPDMFELLAKVSSKKDGFSKTLSAKPVRGGCLVYIEKERQNPDGSHAISDALAFVPNVSIGDDVNDGKKLSQPRL